MSDREIQYHYQSQWFIYNFIPMCPRTRYGYIKWVLLENHCIHYRIFHYNCESWDSLRFKMWVPKQKLWVQDSWCAGKKITDNPRGSRVSISTLILFLCTTCINIFLFSAPPVLRSSSCAPPVFTLSLLLLPACAKAAVSSWHFLQCCH